MSQDGTAVMLEVTGVCRVLHAVAIVETFERSQLLIRPVLGRAWREQRPGPTYLWQCLVKEQMILGSRMVSFLQKVREPKRHTEAGSFQGRFVGMRGSLCDQ